MITTRAPDGANKSKYPLVLHRHCAVDTGIMPEIKNVSNTVYCFFIYNFTIFIVEPDGGG